MYNIGVHDVLLEKKHVDAMGSAVWMYLWCIKHQTTPDGMVLGGTPITYVQIGARLGQSERTLKRWMKTLRKAGYLDVSHLNGKKMRLRVLNPKKQFHEKQLMLALGGEGSDKNGTSEVTKMSLPSRDTVRDTENIKPILELTPESVVPLALWEEYKKMRILIRKPMTNHAIHRILTKLLAFREEGLDVVEILEQSIMNSWTGVFPVKETTNGESFSERRNRKSIEGIAAAFGGNADGVAGENRLALPSGNTERERGRLPRIAN